MCGCHLLLQTACRALQTTLLQLQCTLCMLKLCVTCVAFLWIHPELMVHRSSFLSLA